MLNSQNTHCLSLNVTHFHNWSATKIISDKGGGGISQFLILSDEGGSGGELISDFFADNFDKT